MAIEKLNPYLNFNGTAAKAIEHYRSVLGASVDQISRFGDVPDMQVPADQKDRIMHAALRIGNDTLMVCDTMQNEGVTFGSNVHLVLHFDDADDMTKKFDALAAGGKVTMPLNDTFWGARFGMLEDAFGVRWMFNHDLKKKA